MDKIDIRIKEIVNTNLQESLRYQMTIKKALKQENIKKYKHKKIVHTMISIIIGICVTAGVVFASSAIYEKVWKEPKKYESYDEFMNDYLETVKEPELTEEDKEEAVNEQQAKEKALNLLKNLGYENIEIARIELDKTSYIQEELVYIIKTSTNPNSGFYITINAKNGKILGYQNFDILKTPVDVDKITEDEAKKIAEDICNEFEIKKGDYQLKKISEVPFCYNNQPTNTWNVTYCKVYDGAFNQFERFEVSFFVKDGVKKIQGAGIANENVNFTNNPIVISEEEAIKIAEEENKKITDNKIVYTHAAIQIRQINSFIYAQEQSDGKNTVITEKLDEYGNKITYPQYEITQNTARKVWAVKFDYEIGEPDPNNEYKYWSRLYFVDTTTGEVIGGSWGRRGDDMT